MTIENQTSTSTRSGWVSDLRSSVSQRREARAARRALESELASYRTPAEVQDLFAALRTQDDNPVAEDMRRILFANLEAGHHARTAA